MPAKYNQTQSKGVSEKGMEGSIWIRRRHVVRRRVRIVGGRGGATRAGGGGADLKESEARGVWGCGSRGDGEKGMEGRIWIHRRHVVRGRVRIVGGRGGAPRAGGGGADQKESEARGVWGCGGGRGSELDGGDALDQPPHGARLGRRH